MTVERPLAGRRIAVTRPDAGELATFVAELGGEVVHVPLIEIADPADGGRALRQALLRLAAFDWLAVTSANGALRVGPYAAGHPSLRLAAVGPTTARVLAEVAGRPADLVATVPRVEGLLAEFPRASARVLIAQADRAGSAFADGLVAAGHHVEVVTAYRTVIRRPDPAELAQLTTVDAVVFASGSAATGWVHAVGRSAPAVVVAVGPATARTARTEGLAVTHVAPAPDARSVVALLTRALS
jgi:uroporphyrinogen-III synthase